MTGGSLDVDVVLDAYEEARKFLGHEADEPIPRDELVEQLVAEGYDRTNAREAVGMTLERGDL
ncbi:MAG: hypothetical protein ACLFR5_04660, partial [Halobacteriales archaeon]